MRSRVSPSIVTRLAAPHRPAPAEPSPPSGSCATSSTSYGPCSGWTATAGIALEAHQQNTLVLLDADGWPVGGRYRDNQGYYFRESRRAELERRLPGIGEHSDTFVSDEVTDERFAYYLGINNVLGLIGAFGSQRLADERLLLAAFRRFLTEVAAGPARLAHRCPRCLLDSPTLRCKANLLTRLHGLDELVGPVDTQSVYVTITNPLHPAPPTPRPSTPFTPRNTPTPPPEDVPCLPPTPDRPRSPKAATADYPTGGDSEDTLDLRLPDELVALSRAGAGRRPRRPAAVTICSTARRLGADRTPVGRSSSSPYDRARPAADQPLDERPRRRRLLGTGRPQSRHRGPPARPARRRRAQRALPRRAGRHPDELLGDLPRRPRPAGPALPARPHDTGIHLLIGGVADRGRGLGSTLLRAVADLVLDNRPACTRVVAEPDLRNTPSVSAFLSAGFRFSAEVGPARQAGRPSWSGTAVPAPSALTRPHPCAPGPPLFHTEETSS